MGANFRPGDYVEFIREFDIFPHALVRKGERGKVTSVDDELVSIWLLDRSHAGLDEWQNCAHIYLADEWHGPAGLHVRRVGEARHFGWLCCIYDRFIERHNLTPMAADELACEDVTPAQRRWLMRFVDVWDRDWDGRATS